MANFLQECNQGEMKVEAKTFMETWCVRCSQKQCDFAGFAKTDPMAVRNETWRDRFFGTPLADQSHPKYAEIAKVDFPDLLQKALRLEVSERRGDWSVPEIPFLDAVAKPAASTKIEIPPAPQEEDLEDGEEENPEEDVSEPPKPLPIPLPQPYTPPPKTKNTPDPGEVMIGGEPENTIPSNRQAPPEEIDPWAPKKTTSIVVVSPGTKIQFGQGGKGTVIK